MDGLPVPARRVLLSATPRSTLVGSFTWAGRVPDRSLSKEEGNGDDQNDRRRSIALRVRPGGRRTGNTGAEARRVAYRWSSLPGRPGPARSFTLPMKLARRTAEAPHIVRTAAHNRALTYFAKIIFAAV